MSWRDSNLWPQLKPAKQPLIVHCPRCQAPLLVGANGVVAKCLNCEAAK